MKKKIIALVTVLLMVLGLFPVTVRAADGTITTSDTYNLSDYGNDSTININAGLTVTLAGDDTTYTNVQIVCGEGVSLTMNSVNIDDSTVVDACALSFTGAGNTLTLVGENVLKSGGNHPGVRVEDTAELTIQGGSADKLTATGGTGSSDGGAGIGGEYEKSGGIITINGGVITAIGGSYSYYNGAGIGGDYHGGGGTVTINGGTITATGGGAGAGIGGSRSSDGGTVIINGGTVNATGGLYAAGIGSGMYGDTGSITISGGAVTAIGGSLGAGIGGEGGTIIITGGTIKAIGKNGGADIGGGAGASDPGTLQNEGGCDVYLTPIQLLGSGAGSVAISSLTTDLTGYTYGMNDVFSDSLGWLYFYLPLGTQATQAVTSTGTTFTGGTVTAASPTASYFAAGGADGADGREVELRTDSGYIQWRYAGDSAWNNLIAISAITGSVGATGADGREIELQTDGGYIQWRYAGDTDWQNLAALSAITGPQGATGATGATGAAGENGNMGAAGRGIESITRTGTEGSLDTYTILFTDGTSTAFTVTNGSDGVNGKDGAGLSGNIDENGILVLTLTDGTKLNMGKFAEIIDDAVPVGDAVVYSRKETDPLTIAAPWIAIAGLGIALLTLLSHLGLVPLRRKK